MTNTTIVSTSESTLNVGKQREPGPIMDIFEYSDDESRNGEEEREQIPTAGLCDPLIREQLRTETPDPNRSELTLIKAPQNCLEIQTPIDQGWRPRSIALNSILNGIAFHLAEVERILERKRARKRDPVLLTKCQLDGAAAVTQKPAPVATTPNPTLIPKTPNTKPRDREISLTTSKPTVAFQNPPYPKQNTTLDSSPEIVFDKEVINRHRFHHPSHTTVKKQQSNKMVGAWIDQGDSLFPKYLSRQKGTKRELQLSSSNSLTNQPRRKTSLKYCKDTTTPYGSSTAKYKRQQPSKKYVPTSNIMTSASNVMKQNKREETRFPYGSSAANKDKGQPLTTKSIPSPTATTTSSIWNYEWASTSSESETEFELPDAELPEPRLIRQSDDAMEENEEITYTQQLCRDYNILPTTPDRSRPPLRYQKFTVRKQAEHALTEPNPKPNRQREDTMTEGEEGITFTQQLIRDYDKIPTTPDPPSPPFRYKQSTVRKKAERAKLPGWDCPDCRKYYETIESLEGKEAMLKIRNKCSRHRSKYPIISNTPPDYWNTQIYSTQQLYDEGIIRVGSPFTPPPRRPRRRSSSDSDDNKDNEETVS